MFDYHLHSKLSCDSTCEPGKIVEAAERIGLREICFTDHYDFNDVFLGKGDFFTVEEYHDVYDGLESNKIKIRRGIEFGLTPWDKSQLDELLALYDFDFVIGSVHCAGGYDPYFEEYWIRSGMDKGFEKYLLHTLECVKAHHNFDVLGHLNYVCKSVYNPTKKPLQYHDYSDLCDEIMRVIVQKGIGMEINTSGVDRVGDFLPSIEFMKRFKDLGGEIVTVGSDAHDDTRVGQYIPQALEIVKEVFGYVCTFEQRKVIYHKL